jgi:hypothetical protein
MYPYIEESEEKLILKSALILKNLKRLFTQNNVSLKDNPRPNTIILTEFTAVTSGKHSGRDIS